MGQVLNNNSNHYFTDSNWSAPLHVCKNVRHGVLNNVCVLDDHPLGNYMWNIVLWTFTEWLSLGEVFVTLPYVTLEVSECWSCLFHMLSVHVHVAVPAWPAAVCPVRSCAVVSAGCWCWQCCPAEPELPAAFCVCRQSGTKPGDKKVWDLCRKRRTENT